MGRSFIPCPVVFVLKTRGKKLGGRGGKMKTLGSRENLLENFVTWREGEGGGEMAPKRFRKHLWKGEHPHRRLK